VVKTRSVLWRLCGDIDLAGYLANEVVPVPLVMDLRIAHDKYPNNVDQSLNDVSPDKIRKYRMSRRSVVYYESMK
jgi:hypothetical protein